jgi:hypothetical protein
LNLRKPVLAKIPLDLKGNQHSMIQLMVVDTLLARNHYQAPAYKEQFERDL